MSDPLTKLEDLMEEHYNECRDLFVDFSTVQDWGDAREKAGYLKAIRRVGQFIRLARNPDLKEETGEIPDIFTEGEKNA